MTSLDIKTEDGVIAAYLSGEIDHHSASLLRVQIDSAINSISPQTLVLDFNGITFMDSSGVGLVLGRSKLVKMLGGNLVVQGVSQNIAKVLKLAGVICEVQEGKK